MIRQFHPIKCGIRLRVWQVFQNVVYTEEQASHVHIQNNAPTSNPYSSSFYQLIQKQSLTIRLLCTQRKLASLSHIHSTTPPPQSFLLHQLKHRQGQRVIFGVFFSAVTLSPYPISCNAMCCCVERQGHEIEYKNFDKSGNF